MNEIKIGEHTIQLNIGEELTMREMRLIYPIISKYKDNEAKVIEQIFEIVCALSSQENVSEILDSLSIEEFAELSEKVMWLINQKKK